MKWQLVTVATIIILLSSQLPVRNGQAELTDEFPSENSSHSFGSLARSLKMTAKVSFTWSDDGVKGLSKYILRNGGSKADDLARALGTNADDVFRGVGKGAISKVDDTSLDTLSKFITKHYHTGKHVDLDGFYDDMAHLRRTIDDIDVSRALDNVIDGGVDPNFVTRARKAFDAGFDGTSSSTKAAIESALPDGWNLNKVNALANLPDEALTSTQRNFMRNIRKAIPDPTPDDWCQKVIKIGEIQKYYDGEITQLRGFFAKSDDLAGINSVDDMIDSVAIRKTFDGESELGIIKFKSQPGDFEIPTNDIQRYLDYDPPFTGNGFAGSDTGRIVPEYNRIVREIPDGSELWRMRPDGIMVHEYTYNNGVWMEVLP